MDLAYSAADIIISRAGALAITEICFLKKASILIPSPYVSENHQLKNAKALEKNEACFIVEEKDLKSHFFTKLDLLLKNENYRKKMAKNAQKISVVDSSKKIVAVINEIINNEEI